jgi:hypothetical protein
MPGPNQSQVLLRFSRRLSTLAALPLGWGERSNSAMLGSPAASHVMKAASINEYYTDTNRAADD